MRRIIDFLLCFFSVGYIWLYWLGPWMDLTAEAMFFSWGMTLMFVYVFEWVIGIWRMTRG